MAEQRHTGRKLALVGGAGLAAWWLFSRGKGWGFRTSGDGHEDARAARSRIVVWVRGDRIDVDGVASDLPTVIAKGRAAGEADVHATGDAIVRRVRDVVVGLRAAGVTVYLAGDLGRTNWETL
jgi:hypothetical protein